MYLLMPIKDQKSILLHHDRSQKRIRQEFTDSKDKLKANIHKKMEKWLKEFNYDSIDGNRGLLQVLTSPLKDLSSISKEKPESTLLIERD